MTRAVAAQGAGLRRLPELPRITFSQSMLNQSGSALRTRYAPLGGFPVCQVDGSQQAAPECQPAYRDWHPADGGLTDWRLRSCPAADSRCTLWS
jgi:hypothetical protein